MQSHYLYLHCCQHPFVIVAEKERQQKAVIKGSQTFLPRLPSSFTFLSLLHNHNRKNRSQVHHYSFSGYLLSMYLPFLKTLLTVVQKIHYILSAKWTIWINNGCLIVWEMLLHLKSFSHHLTEAWALHIYYLHWHCARARHDCLEGVAGSQHTLSCVQCRVESAQHRPLSHHMCWSQKCGWSQLLRVVTPSQSSVSPGMANISAHLHTV